MTSATKYGILYAKSAIPTQNHKSIHPQTSQKFTMSKTELTILIPHNLLLFPYSHLNELPHRPPGGPSQTSRSQGWLLPHPSVTKSSRLLPSNITQIRILPFTHIVSDSVQSLIISSWNCFNHLLSNLPACRVASYSMLLLEWLS